MEILTVKEVAAMLRLSVSQIYELTRPRTKSGDLREHPIPVLRIGTAVRFVRKDVEEWLEKLKKSVA
jgi:predicted DNA-binding transcriptional regulator AlpA